MTKLFRAITLLYIIISTRASFAAKLDSLSDGIHFVEGLSWKDILAKAKREGKYVFVDCYATWCGPCKRMEREVYSRRNVGDSLNEKFIAVKAQLDSSNADNATTRAFYLDAHYIKTKYDIQIYPTLLFFDPDGNILNKVSGAMDASELLKLVADAQNPKKDYYALLARYKSGEKNLTTMSYLARKALSLLKDTVQSEAIAMEYIRSLKKEDWMSVSNIIFMRDFTRHSWDPGFSFFFQNADSIDKTMNDDSYSEAVVQHALYLEVVRPEIENSEKVMITPNWYRIASTITNKFNEYYANRVVLGAKTDWSGLHKDWPQHTKDLILFLEKYGPKTDTGGRFEAVYLNNCAWDIFEHSTDSVALKTALQWSLRAVMMDPEPDWMDTYANILYKLGRRKDALKWEEVSVTLAHGANSLRSTYEAMKAGKPTWPSD